MEFDISDPLAPALIGGLVGAVVAGMWRDISDRRYRRRVGTSAAHLILLELTDAALMLNVVLRQPFDDRPEFREWRLDRSLLRDRFGDLAWVLDSAELVEVASAFQDAALLNQRYAEFVNSRLSGTTYRDIDLEDWAAILEDAATVVRCTLIGGTAPFYLLNPESRRARRRKAEVMAKRAPKSLARSR
ncbi:MAG: hypothetical protein O2888_02435 [Chloroflexi bacterium]|nr:hypothetical protein [Chloroflexota bacterium]